MKKFTRLIAALLLAAVLLTGLSGCEGDLSGMLAEIMSSLGQTEDEITEINIANDDEGDITIKVGETIQLEIDNMSDANLANVIWSTVSPCISLSGGSVTGLSEGKATVFAQYGELVDKVIIEVMPGDGQGGTNDGENDDQGGTNSGGNGNENGDQNNGNDGGNTDHVGYQASVSFDPYKGMTEDEFYVDYIPAVSYWDSYYRTLHYFMSGTIAEQDQEPTISAYQPKVGDKFVRNNVGIYGDDGNSYTIVDACGNPVMTIYRGGAYIMLEEVAAHLFAFGQITANHSTSKRAKPTESPWGEYLRVNHTEFSGSTTKYPYEPKLPNISGCGGDLTYYELDIGTTGTDCDPKYSAVVYNNGSRIERGAARIVYTVYDKNGDKIIDINEKYLFYTYNHYNDFQEYLNYWGGWGEMFGNITGGGTISSKYHYSPTPYVETVRMDISKMVAFIALPEWYMPVDDKKYA